MAKGESLMGEVATDWMDTECPEAKRLKVVFPPVTPALRVLVSLYHRKGIVINSSWPFRWKTESQVTENIYKGL